MKSSSSLQWRWIIVAAAVAGGAAWLSFSINPPTGGRGVTQAVTWTAGAPKSVPAFTFTDQDGKTLSLGDFKGKVVVLDVWATWCAPCRAEFPRFDRLQAALGDKGLVVIPVSQDLGGRKPVDKFYDELGVKALSKYIDPDNATAKALGLRGLPTTLIIDREGREIARIEGEAPWDSAETLARFETLLAGNGS